MWSKIFLVLLVLIVLFMLYSYFFYEDEEEMENFSNVSGTMQNEDNMLNNDLSDYYKTQKYITKNIILNQDSNNQNNAKNTDMDFQLVGHNNLLNVDNVAFDKFKKLYSHQIDCPCVNNKVIGFDDCKNNLDVFKISNNALMEHDDRDCVTCNFLPSATLTPEQMKNDAENVISNKLIDSNLDNYSNYRMVSNQNSNMGENVIDRINECRTSGTCDLSKFGSTLWGGYDNLMSGSNSQMQTTTNPDLIGGYNPMMF